MSASKEKRVRNAIRSEGGDKKAIAAAEKAKQDKKFKTTAIIVVIVVALLFAAAAVINSDLFYTATTAIKIGDTKYSPAEYNFCYNSIYNSTYSELYETYGEMTAYIIDTESPLDEQISIYGDGQMTWDDYFHDQAVADLTSITVLYDAAMAEGYTLSADAQTEIDTALSTYELYAQMNGVTLDGYLELSFGKGVDSKLFTEFYTKQSIAADYSEDLSEGFTYTADELEAYYAEHKDTLDFVTYQLYFVGTSNDNFADMTDEEKALAATEAAEAIAEATTPEEFAEKISAFVAEDYKENYDEVSETRSINQGGYISDTYSEWLLDASRVEGDTTTVEAEGGTYAIMFVSRNDNHYNTVNARHILIEAEADENGEYTEDALAVALATAEEIYATWQEDPTEENFAALAEAHSTDTGSNTNGGLYEEIFQDYMDEEFDAFLFDEHHLPGDTAIVYGTNGYYAGYHIIYFVGEGPVYSDLLAENAARSEDYNAIVTELVEAYEVSEGSGMRFVG